MRRAGPRALGLAAALLLLCSGGALRAQERAPDSPVGLWETISDVDGKPKGHIRIREAEGELRGTVEAILDPAKRDKRCESCSDERRDQPVLGMTVVNGMHRDGDHYGGGRILDPDNGKVYSCKMTLVDGGKHLQVRGFIGFSLLGRTQTWNRLE
jgi:uncharacterized protein (DUF2147 family)